MMGNSCGSNRIGLFSSRSSVSSNADIQAGFCNADPITKEGKRIHMIQVCNIFFISKMVQIGANEYHFWLYGAMLYV